MKTSARNSLILLAVFGLLLSGCKSKPTTQPHAERWAAPVPQLHVKVRLFVEKDLVKVEEESLSLEETVTRCLKKAGFTVVEENAPVFDATLRIKIRAEALSRYYSYFNDPSQGEYKPTGAKVSGVISYEVAQTPTEEGTFEYESPPPQTVDLQDRSSPYPPIDLSLWQSGFYEKLAVLVDAHYGQKAAVGYWLGALSSAKSNKDEPFDKAVEKLANIGTPAARFLAFVLENDANLYVQAGAAEVLGKIGDKRALEALDQARKNKDNSVLVQITATEAADAIRRRY